MNHIVLPTLYKTTATGATQICNISVYGKCIITEWGQQFGVMQTKRDTIESGKNIGKLNETTPEQQTRFEAKSKWNRKVKSGYSVAESTNTKVNLPMKVKSWTQGKLPPKVSFPLYSTPKFNGVNATYRLTNGKLVLTSRGGDILPSIPHIEGQLLPLMEYFNITELNGELYIHGEYLQYITAAVRKSNELSVKLQFIIFDIPSMDAVFESRVELFQPISDYLLEQYNEDNITITPTPVTICESHDDIEECYDKAIADGLEGTVIKHPLAMYKHNIRSNRMWKYKKAQSIEVLITGMTLDKNNQPVFTCTHNNQLFSCKPKGTAAERQAIVDSFDTEYLDHWYTIEFETYSATGIPLKPVGIALRNCNSEGEPIE